MIGKKRMFSFRTKLLGAFCVAGLLPLMFFFAFSIVTTMGLVKRNINDVARISLMQTQSNLEVSLDSYKDILYQLYTNDEIINIIKDLDERHNLAVARNQLRRRLQTLLYTKKYIKSITVITHSGMMVWYDSLTSKSDESSWIDTLDISQEELYQEISSDNLLHFIPTHRADDFAGKKNYLFHLGHRIINYKDTERDIGIIIMSIDEQFMGDICTANWANGIPDYTNFHIVVDSNGVLVSSPAKEFLGMQIFDSNQADKQEHCVRELVYQANLAEEGASVEIRRQNEGELGLTIFNISNQSIYTAEWKKQLGTLIIVSCMIFILAVVLINLLTEPLNRSIKEVVATIQKTSAGDLSARVSITHRMPEEIQKIGIQYNKMLNQLKDSLQKEKKAYIKQKDAEITALEAQINPHFLYNTLDTINWMAIDKDEFEISESISNLAKIMRYGIDNSNGIVTVREEMEWIQQYISLQKSRLKSNLICEVYAEEVAEGYQIHKLLLQPFVENVFIHGFKGISYTPKIMISFLVKNKALIILIQDNGVGISSDVVENINRGEGPALKTKNHIGVENAINRIRLYYGAKALVSVSSEQGEGTKIIITIPHEEVRNT